MKHSENEFKNWVESIELQKFSRDFRNFLLEFAALNTKAINTDVETLYIQLIGLLEVLDSLIDNEGRGKRVRTKKKG